MKNQKLKSHPSLIRIFPRCYHLKQKLAVALGLAAATLLLPAKTSAQCATATAGGGWQNTAMTSQTGTFTATCDATPSASPTNAVVALSNGAQTAYANFACLARFNPSGDIDARNGGAYASSSTIPYSAGVSYHFRLVVDISTQTYSIYVTPAGGSELTVGVNYAFRISDTTLNYWGVYVDSGSGGTGSVTVCNFSTGGTLPQAATPSFSPSAGTYSSAQSVSITTGTSGASIRYTTDGSTPSETTGTIYSGPVYIGATTTLTAIAYASGYADSTVASGTYTIATGGTCVTATVGGSFQNSSMSSETGTFTATCDATPTASPTNAVVALSNGAQTSYSNFACLVRFNPSGDIDARNGGAYAAASTIPYSANVSYHFRLVVNVSAQTYSIYVTPAGGSELTVGTNYAFRISDTTLNNWAVYVDSSSGGAGSVTVCNFSTGIPPPPQVATPTFNPAGGTYTSAQNVSLSDSTSGATIYYTTNGTTPTTSSTVYSGPIPVSSGTVTIEAFGAESGFTNSNVASATYTISPVQQQVATPMFSPAGGTYTSALNVSLSDSTGGATIYYTTNGATPTTSSTVYSGPIPVSSGTVIIEALGAESGFANSNVTSSTYTVATPTVATPTFSPGSGTYTSAQSVSLSDSTGGATIYYTTNGTTPTTSSTVYSSPIPVSSGTVTIEAIGAESGFTTSSVTSATYTIVIPTVATPTFSPGSGTYTSAQSVSLSDATSGASIYYTTNGTTPTTSSTVYSGPISVSSGTVTIEAIGAKAGFTTSSAASATYTINSGTGLNPNLPPGENFDLSNWELQLPIGSAGNPTTITQPQLQIFTDPYFYTDKTDGAMTFFTPENGVHTANSSFPRSELRELKPGGDWPETGTHTMTATLKVEDTLAHVSIGQIHIGTGGTPTSTKPLLELFYYSTGQINMLLETSPSGGGPEIPLTTVPLGTKFSYTIKLSGSALTIIVNGVTSNYTINSSYSNERFYFKAGDYLQTTGSSSTVGAHVAFYALNVVHQ